MELAFGLYIHFDNGLFGRVCCDYPDKELIVLMPIHTSQRALCAVKPEELLLE